MYNHNPYNRVLIPLKTYSKLSSRCLMIKIYNLSNKTIKFSKFKNTISEVYSNLTLSVNKLIVDGADCYLIDNNTIELPEEVFKQIRQYKHITVSYPANCIPHPININKLTFYGFKEGFKGSTSFILDNGRELTFVTPVKHLSKFCSDRYSIAVAICGIMAGILYIILR